MQVSEWHNRSAKVGGIRRDCLREQGGPGARQLPRVSTSLASLSRLSSPSLPNHLFLTIYARLFFPFDVRSPLSPLFSPSRSFSTIVLSIYICLSCFLVRDLLFVTPRDFAGLTSQYIRTHKTSSLYARLYEYTRLTDSSWTPLFYWFILALGISVALSLPRSTDHDRSKRVAASPAENRGSANRSIHGWLAARRRVASRRHREGPVQPRSLRLSMTGKHDFRLANEYTSAIHRPIFFLILFLRIDGFQSVNVTIVASPDKFLIVLEQRLRGIFISSYVVSDEKRTLFACIIYVSRITRFSTITARWRFLTTLFFLFWYYK